VTFGDSKRIVVFIATQLGRHTMEDDVPKTLSVPEAGRRYFGLAKNASYAAAARREIPTIRIGSKLRVPVIALERMLAEAGTDKAA
jgi:hypothetical protein